MLYAGNYSNGLENIVTEPKKHFQVWLLVSQNLNAVTTEFLKSLLQSMGKVMLAVALSDSVTMGKF